MSLKLYNAGASSASQSSTPVGSGPSVELLLTNILLELRVMNEYLGHQADTNGPVDEVRTELLLEII